MRKHREQNYKLTLCSLFFWGDKYLLFKQDNISLLKLPMCKHTLERSAASVKMVEISTYSKKIEIQHHLWTVTNYDKEGKKIQGPNL